MEGVSGDVKHIIQNAECAEFAFWREQGGLDRCYIIKGHGRVQKAGWYPTGCNYSAAVDIEAGRRKRKFSYFCEGWVGGGGVPVRDGWTYCCCCCCC